MRIVQCAARAHALTLAPYAMRPIAPAVGAGMVAHASVSASLIAYVVVVEPGRAALCVRGGGHVRVSVCGCVYRTMLCSRTCDSPYGRFPSSTRRRSHDTRTKSREARRLAQPLRHEERGLQHGRSPRAPARRRVAGGESRTDLDRAFVVESRVVEWQTLDAS